MSAMIRFRQHLVGNLLFCGTLLTGVLMAQPDVPPPTVDQEGTEAAWDITHPGWREWGNQRDEDAPATGQTGQTNQGEIQVLKRKQEEQQKQLEEAKKNQQEEEKRRRELEQYWLQVQAQQRRQQVQQQQQAAERQRLFEQAKQTLLANFRVPSDSIQAGPSGVSENREDTATGSAYSQSSFGLAAKASAGYGNGLSSQEWQQARHYQALLNALVSSPDLPPEDKAILGRIEARRNALWAKAVSVPGLPDDDREVLALRLPVTQTQDRTVVLTPEQSNALDRRVAQTSASEDSVLGALLSDLYVAKGEEAATQGSEALVDRLLGKEATERFGDFLGVAKIAMATAKDGTSSGMAAALDVVVGKIPFPQATLAVEGGRQVANLAFQAQSRFMVDAMKVVGVDFDIQAFWKQFKEELGTGQKAVMEFVSYGPKD